MSMMRKTSALLAVLAGVFLTYQPTSARADGYTPLPSGTARIWDSVKKYSMKHYDFRAWKDKQNWLQVPYGTTDYKFKGNAILEGESFWISLHTSNKDGPFMYTKLDAKGTPSCHNEWYTHYDAPVRSKTGKYGFGSRAGRLRTGSWFPEKLKILKNQPKEVILQVGGRRHSINQKIFEKGEAFCEFTMAYRLVGGRRWVELRPVKDASGIGMHGETRMVIAPKAGPGGQDFVLDSMIHSHPRRWSSDSPVRWAPVRDFVSHGKFPYNTKLIINLQKMYGDYMFVMTWPSPVDARPYAIFHQGGGRKGWAESWCIITSTWGLFGRAGPGTGQDKLIVAPLNNLGNWHFERVAKKIRKRSKYTVTWKAKYPGLWRMVGCIGQGDAHDLRFRHYSFDVRVDDTKKDKFVFKSPATGWLEYVVVYLYDRTERTPKSVSTPMDVYREAIGDEKPRRRSDGPFALRTMEIKQ
ncbi:MAG: hypothetical protein KAV00_13100, partial [Phycisphaerae bacterium]|nr:hypothetical protein [Phycisphaerae bacterium]